MVKMKVTIEDHNSEGDLLDKEVDVGIELKAVQIVSLKSSVNTEQKIQTSPFSRINKPPNEA